MGRKKLFPCANWRKEQYCINAHQLLFEMNSSRKDNDLIFVPDGRTCQAIRLGWDRASLPGCENSCINRTVQQKLQVQDKKKKTDERAIEQGRNRHLNSAQMRANGSATKKIATG
jgi:hypothetical protein